jgi:hypothetical protein
MVNTLPEDGEAIVMNVLIDPIAIAMVHMMIVQPAILNRPGIPGMTGLNLSIVGTVIATHQIVQNRIMQRKAQKVVSRVAVQKDVPKRAGDGKLS